jgi:hypothetical protein
MTDEPNGGRAAGDAPAPSQAVRQPGSAQRGGYEADVLRRAVALLVAGLPPESRARASGELIRAVEDLHAREGVPFGGGATAPLDLIRDELRQRASETSWRRVGRESELSPRSLQMIAERQTKCPLPRTQAKLQRWASRRFAESRDPEAV